MPDRPISLAALAPWVTFIATVATGGWYVAKLDSRVEALETRVAVVEADDGVAGDIRSLRCFIARLHNAPQPECP